LAHVQTVILASDFPKHFAVIAYQDIPSTILLENVIVKHFK
jgi:hypothetical protein